MQIKVSNDEEITFDFDLKHDTPELVAREFVEEAQLGENYFISLRDGIQKLLKNY